MTLTVIMLSLLVLLLLAYVILSWREIHSMSRELKKIRSETTNQLVHTSGVAKYSELVEIINNMLLDMQKMRAEYAKKNHSLDSMLTNISHDLRTPLTSAMGYIGLVVDPEITEEEKQRELDIIRRRLLRLEELIDSFFEFSRMIASERAPELSVISLNSVLEECIVHYYDDYSSRNRCVDLRCKDNRIKISSNRNMLMRVFDNLISNAFKHGKGDLIVNVDTSSAETVELSFSNIPDGDFPDIDLVFDEFYTTDISRTRNNTGLGLAIAKQFTEMLGGSIKAENKDGYFNIIIRFKR